MNWFGWYLISDKQKSIVIFGGGREEFTTAISISQEGATAQASSTAHYVVLYT